MGVVHCVVGLTLAMVGDAALAQASKYPVRAVRMIVGFSPGGATDIIARTLAPSLTRSRATPSSDSSGIFVRSINFSLTSPSP